MVKTQDPSGVGAAEDATMKVATATNWGRSGVKNPMVNTLQSMAQKWVCLKMVSTPKPNGFADHYPVFKWLFHWEYTLFSDKPKCMIIPSNMIIWYVPKVFVIY